MQGHKRILGSDAVRRMLCWLGAQYIRFVHATGRWSVVRGDVPQALWERGEPFILCFWHGRLLMMPYCWNRRVAIHMLISQHRDGQIIARTVGHFGIHAIAGSSKRGGAGALRAMLKALQAGECVGITPDGPRGPRMRASDGIVSVARLAGVPVVPATFAVDRRKVLGSWDRFVVAWPFARGVLVWGEPITVERDADDAAIEAARARVETALNAITAEADGLVGASPIEPAPTGTEEAAP
ncbi:lysophospholipid acyltransferase family protein [Shumkonia mesophila]|uniref:lysophospholipid acyltransferase family protein n=1 Tax=Shumkonia mesophila TaxID=2838854 RepID=UPI0029348AC1|nr:lysophospholipid acyltransferase family protein [Shumkonia mesophila]